MKVAVTSVVSTGRRMQSSDKFMSESRLRLARGDARPVSDLQLPFGHDQLAAFEAAFKDSLPVDNARHLDRLDLRNDVLDDEYERPGWPDLNGARRQHHRLLPAKAQLNRDQCTGP